MTRWWYVRMAWLGLGLLVGVIGLLPVTASGSIAVINGILALIYIAAFIILLIRWARAAPAIEKGKGDALSLRRGLLWDSMFFFSASVICAYFFSLLK